MSRSYKEVAICGDKKGKSKKRAANSKVRNWLKQHPDIQIQYSKYKQIFETYDICDCYWFMSWEEYQKYGYGTYRDWYQRYKAK